MSDPPPLDEEKYTGPILHTAPEMIVSSGPGGPSTSGSGKSRKVPKIENMMYNNQDNDLDLPSPTRKTPMEKKEPPSVNTEIAGTSSSSNSEGKQMDSDEAALARYKEIGRRLCELDASDFLYDNHRADKKSFMISARGEEILAAVRRNLGVIANKLGDLAEGTIFAHGDELATSFANVNPESLTRLNERVAEKVKARADAAALSLSMKQVADVPGTSQISIKEEDPDVKREPLDDYHY